MIKATVYQIRDEFILVKRDSVNPLYPLYIRVSKNHISSDNCYLDCSGYVIPIGGNEYKFNRM